MAWQDMAGQRRRDESKGAYIEVYKHRKRIPQRTRM